MIGKKYSWARLFVPLLAGGTGLPPFLFNFLTTCFFFYFLQLQIQYTTAVITKKKANGKDNNTQNSRTHKDIHLSALMQFQFCSGQIFFLLSCFHYLKRAEKTSIHVTLQMLTQDTSTLLQQMHTQQFCSTIILSTTQTRYSKEYLSKM